MNFIKSTPENFLFILILLRTATFAIQLHFVLFVCLFIFFFFCWECILFIFYIFFFSFRVYLFRRVILYRYLRLLTRSTIHRCNPVNEKAFLVTFIHFFNLTILKGHISNHTLFIFIFLLLFFFFVIFSFQI